MNLYLLGMKIAQSVGITDDPCGVVQTQTRLKMSHERVTFLVKMQAQTIQDF